MGYVRGLASNIAGAHIVVHTVLHNAKFSAVATSDFYVYPISGFCPISNSQGFPGAIALLGNSCAAGRGGSCGGPHPRRYDGAPGPRPPPAPVATCLSWPVLIKINDLPSHSLGNHLGQGSCLGHTGPSQPQPSIEESRAGGINLRRELWEEGPSVGEDVAAQPDS